MKIGGVSIRSYDAHNDGIVFEDFLLRHQFIDVNQDKILDIVLSGVAIKTGEKEWDTITKRAVVSILIFDKKTNKYLNTVPDTAIKVREI